MHYLLYVIHRRSHKMETYLDPIAAANTTSFIFVFSSFFDYDSADITL